MALAALSVTPDPAPELRAGFREDTARLWHTGRGRGLALTAKIAGRVVQQAGFATWFSVQAGVAEWMAAPRSGDPRRP